MKKFIIALLVAAAVISAPQKAHAGLFTDIGNFFVSVFIRKPAPVVPRYAEPNTPQDSLYYNTQNNLYYDTPPTSAAGAQPVNPNTPRSSELVSTCGFKVTTLAPNTKVYNPIVIRGTITRNSTDCTWKSFEGQAGIAQMYYNSGQGWQKAGPSSVISTENENSNGAAWMVPINFLTNPRTLPVGTPLKLVFTEENPSGTSAAHTYELPLSYRGSDPQILNDQRTDSTSGGIVLSVTGGGEVIGTEPNRAYQTYLSFTGSTVSRPAAKWSLSFVCPAGTDVSTSPGASCQNPFIMSTTQNAGNVVSKAFVFKNSANSNQTVTAKLTAYDASGATMGQSSVAISVPPTGGGTQTWSQVQLLSPNGGQVFYAGQQIPVTWKTFSGSFNYSATSKVTIYLETAVPGQSRVVKATYTNLPNTGSAQITIPSTIAAGSNYSIDVIVYADAPAPEGSAQSDQSDKVFTIVTPSPSPTPPVTADPTSNTTVEPLVISGTSVVQVVPGDTVTVYAKGTQTDQTYYIYLVGNGFSNTVGLTPVSPGVFSFKVPVEPAGSVELYLRGYKGSTLISQSQSGAGGASITINAPAAAAPVTYPFVLSTPVAGQTWLNGNGYAIQFYGGSATDHLKVDFVNSSTGAVTNVRADVAPMPSIQSTIFFEVPASLPVGSYNVKITNLTTGQIIATSPVVTVAPPPPGIGVVVQSGTYPITYKGGDIVPIFIAASNYPTGTTFDVKLATRALTAGSTIVPGITLKSGITGSGNVTYNWQIPTSLASANNYLILVCPSTGTECGHSLTFTISNTTPSPTGSPVSEAQSHNFMANVFYSVGEALDSVF